MAFWAFWASTDIPIPELSVARHLLVKGVFVCKVYAEVFGEFITKTKSYVMLCDGWEAY
jgi:hypothetical protein